MARQVPLELTRNIGIMAHIDAGKPPQPSAYCFIPALITRWVRHMTAPPPWTDGTGAGARHYNHLGGHHMFLEKPQNKYYRHPGHVDFTVEVQRSLRVLDGSVTVLRQRRGRAPVGNGMASGRPIQGSPHRVRQQDGHHGRRLLPRRQHDERAS